MTAPRARSVAHYDRYRRFYDLPDGRTFPSVTNLLDAVAKPALIPWAAKVERELVTEAAACLWEDAPLSPKMSREAFIASLTNRLGKTRAHQKELAKATEIGSSLHALIEWNLRRELGQVVGPEPHVKDSALWAFMVWEDWRKTVNLKPRAIEQVVWSTTHEYAGTMDLLAECTLPEIGTVLAVADWKCLLPKQRLMRADGSFVRADQVFPDDELAGWVPTDGFCASRVRGVYPGGVQPCVEVVTVYGRRLCVSANHPVLSAGKWVEASKLRKGDPLVLCDRPPYMGRSDVSSEDSLQSLAAARLLGYMIGDGSMAGGQRRFANYTPELVADARAIASSLGFTWSEVPSRPHNYTIGGMGSWLRSHGLYGKRSETKQIPDAIMRGTPEAVRAFLTAYFDCDGYVSRAGLPPFIQFTTVSEYLAADTQELLWRMGIRAYCWRQDKKMYRGKLHERPPYFTKVSGWGNVPALARFLCDSRVPRKAERLAHWMTAPMPRTAGRRTNPVETVATVRNLPDQATIAIEMEHGTFVTSGIVTHNTGKAVYGEAFLQNTAYVHAMVEMGHVTPPVYGLIVRLPKIESDPEPEFVVLPWERLEALFPVFLAVKKLWAWQEEERLARTGEKKPEAPAPAPALPVQAGLAKHQADLLEHIRTLPPGTVTVDGGRADGKVFVWLSVAVLIRLGTKKPDGPLPVLLSDLSAAETKRIRLALKTPELVTTMATGASDGRETS